MGKHSFREFKVYMAYANNWSLYAKYGLFKINRNDLWFLSHIRVLMMRGIDHLGAREYFECLEFIHCVFLSLLEMEMGDVIKALTVFEEKCK